MTSPEPNSGLPARDATLCQFGDVPWKWGAELNNPLDDGTVSRAWMHRPRVGQLVCSRPRAEDPWQPLGRVVCVDKSIVTHKRHTDGSEDCFIWCHREDAAPGFSLNTLHTWNGPSREGVAPINNLARYLQAVALVADLQAARQLLSAFDAQLLTTLEALVQEAEQFVQRDQDFVTGFSWRDKYFFQFDLARIEAGQLTTEGLAVFTTSAHSAALLLQQFCPPGIQLESDIHFTKRGGEPVPDLPGVRWRVVLTEHEMFPGGVAWADGAERCIKHVHD